jgi:hypothetical protein
MAVFCIFLELDTAYDCTTCSRTFSGHVVMYLSHYKTKLVIWGHCGALKVTVFELKIATNTKKWLYFAYFSSCTQHVTVKLIREHSADMSRCIGCDKWKNWAC